jgi:hypothetical protein
MCMACLSRPLVRRRSAARTNQATNVHDLPRFTLICRDLASRISWIPTSRRIRDAANSGPTSDNCTPGALPRRAARQKQLSVRSAVGAPRARTPTASVGANCGSHVSEGTLYAHRSARHVRGSNCPRTAVSWSGRRCLLSWQTSSRATSESSSAASDVSLAPFGSRIIRAMQPSTPRGETAECVAKGWPGRRRAWPLSCRLSDGQLEAALAAKALVSADDRQ